MLSGSVPDFTTSFKALFISDVEKDLDLLLVPGIVVADPELGIPGFGDQTRRMATALALTHWL